jgi:hypothetical protein
MGLNSEGAKARRQGAEKRIDRLVGQRAKRSARTRLVARSPKVNTRDPSPSQAARCCIHEPRSVQFDHENRVARPFQLLTGGSQIIFINGKFTNAFGSKARAKRFAKEDRRGHRSETRKVGALQCAQLAMLARPRLTRAAS